ncbi:MAG: hypothetical protein M0Z41_18630 [Peptococcaceae bacterium]|jgi:hypothetical protein|nr:hypothetical protein [Peptococcaceae bacterium]
MVTIGVLLFLAVITALFSLREKTRQIRLRDMSSEPDRSSPLSRALAELVGTAGGIYLSLTLARDFLKLDVPGRVPVWPWHIEVEPLAALSLVLALLQPYVMRLYHEFNR